jgi:hypothetical protein
MDFNTFRGQWLGEVIDFDHVYAYQCVDLILEYIYECYGINSGVSGNAIDYWVKSGIGGFNQNLLDKFDKIPNSDAQQGDIVVLNGLPGNSLGHIGLATGNINDTDIEILEQNGSSGNGLGKDGDVIRVRYVPRWRVAGLLRPKVPVNSPVPLPEVHPYTVESIEPKQVKLNRHTHLWGLNYDNFTAIDANPQADAVAGTIITVTAVLHHNIGYNYYLSDPNVASGYNTLDCDDYVPPAPYTPPAGPMVIPNSETYDLIKDVDGYITSNQAVNHIDPKVTVPAGTYFIFNKRFNAADTSQLIALNLTKTPGKPGAWINPLDNVELPPEPVLVPEAPIEQLIVDDKPAEPAFASTYKLLSEPRVYVAMRDVPVADLAGTRVVKMPKYSVTYISGTFTINGVDYARPKSAADKGLWYGIEYFDRATGLKNIELESEVYNAKTTIAERQATKSLKTIDRLALGAAHLRNIYLAITSFFSKIKSDRKNKK